MTVRYNLTALNGNYPSLGASLANNLGRQQPCDKINGGLCQPYVIPWTLSTDANGYAYPGGIVGIVFGPGTYDPNQGGTYEGQMLSVWENTTAVPVPSTLPSGYTAALRRYDPISTTGARTATGPLYSGVTYPWLPAAIAGDGGFGSPTGADSYDGSNYHWYATILPSIGFRYCYLQWIFIGGAPPLSSFTLNITVSHNHDGSDPGNADGDTTDFTGTFTDGSFTGANSGFGYWTYLSNFLTVGALNPTRGTCSVYKFHGKSGSQIPFSNYNLGFPHQQYIQVKTAAAIIPYPWTCTGDMGLIAPGGTPS